MINPSSFADALLVHLLATAADSSEVSHSGDERGGGGLRYNVSSLYMHAAFDIHSIKSID